jgi:hypothetical protein
LLHEPLATDFGDALVSQSEAALLEAEVELGLALAWARLAVLLGAEPTDPAAVHREDSPP